MLPLPNSMYHRTFSKMVKLLFQKPIQKFALFWCLFQGTHHSKNWFSNYRGKVAIREIKIKKTWCDLQGHSPAGGGCQFSGEAAMFQQTEETSSPLTDWTWRFLTQPSLVENTVGWPTYRWMPDGHLSTIQVTWSILGRIFILFRNVKIFKFHGTQTFLSMRYHICNIPTLSQSVS